MVENAPCPSKVAILKSAHNWLAELLDRLPDAPLVEEEEAPEDASELRAFDPDRDSAADAIMWAENFYKDAQEWGEDGALEFRADGAFKWMHQTAGLNLYEIEKRLKEFPEINFPKDISDRYDREAPRGLHAVLRQIWLAYIIGADLAAIALCRSVTELLIRFHYAYDISDATNSNKTKLTAKDPEKARPPPLIYQVERKDEFALLKKFNLTERVTQANRILHMDNDETDAQIQHRDPDREFVTGWLRDLGEMIDQAPPGEPASPV